MIKVNGLEKLTAQMKDAQRAFEALDGDLGSIKYDPNDPSSIDASIHHMEALIDERLSQYASNPFVQPLIFQMKENFRRQILEHASGERLKGQ